MGKKNSSIDDRPGYASVLGLGFGDCGKGLFTDFLCRRWQAHTVVRFNGSSQAGHNVVLPNGLHHTFSQFGSGSFIPETATVLASPVAVHPSAMLVENDFLKKAGVNDALDRMIIDARCRVITPYHQSAGRLRELNRGPSAHGTCGAGAGETVRHSLNHQDEAIHYGDLQNPGTVRAKLEIIRKRLLAEFHETEKQSDTQSYAELKILKDENISDIWLETISTLLKSVPPASADAVASRCNLKGTVIFEGAQGFLLDEWRGFHPHTTWSSTHTGAVNSLARDLLLPEPVRHYGVLRSFLTRHGNGPLPTHDPNLNYLPEPHNSSDNWQGEFRRAHPDAVLLRYALSNIGTLSGLLISHLDIFDKGNSLRWCSKYKTKDSGYFEEIPSSEGQDLKHQMRLTELLKQASPVYDQEYVASADSFLARLAGLTDTPVSFGSYGNTHITVYPGGVKK